MKIVKIALILSFWKGAFKEASASEAIRAGIDCAKDDTCSGILWQSDDSAIKVPITELSVALTNPDFKFKQPGQGFTTFTEPLLTLTASLRQNALRFGFDREVQYDAGYQQFTRYYKVYKYPQKMNFPNLEKQCLMDNGIPPVANMSASGIKKMYETLAVNVETLMIGLKRHLVSGDVYRLTWSTGQILGEGTLAELAKDLAHVGFNNIQDEPGVGVVYTYVHCKSNLY